MIDPRRRWAQVEALFDALWELEPGQRDARIADIADPAVAAELRAMFTAAALDERWLAPGPASPAAVPPRAVARPIDAGRRIGAWRIVGLVGRGGMGEVYRASTSRWRSTARALMARRPQLEAPCALLTRAAVEAIVGPLSAEPLARRDACELHGAKGVYAWQVADATGGYAAMRKTTALQAGDAGAISRRADGGDMNEQRRGVLQNLAGGLEPKPLDNPAWDRGVVSMRGLYVVRKDVRIGCSTTLNAAQVDVCTQLAAAVAERL